MHKNLKRGLAKGPLNPEAKTWPGLAELSLLRVIGTVWPTSDMNHPVISPARLLMGAYLGLGRVRSLIDIASGLFLCTMYLQFEHLSKRFVPEAINFLINTVLHLCPHRFEHVSILPGSFPSPDFLSDLCQPLKVKVKKLGGLTVDRPNLTSIMCGDTTDEQTKVDLLALAVDLLGQFAEMYKSLDGFIELYQPIHDIVSKLDTSKLPKGLQVCGFICIPLNTLTFLFRRTLPLSVMQQAVYSNSQLKLANLLPCKRTNQSQSRPTFPNSNPHRHHIYVVKIPTTSGTKPPSYGINTSKKGRVPSGSCGRIHASLPL